MSSIEESGGRCRKMHQQYDELYKKPSIPRGPMVTQRKPIYMSMEDWQAFNDPSVEFDEEVWKQAGFQTTDDWMRYRQITDQIRKYDEERKNFQTELSNLETRMKRVTGRELGEIKKKVQSLKQRIKYREKRIDEFNEMLE